MSQPYYYNHYNPHHQEPVLYQDAAGVTITPTRAVLGPKTFYLSNLTSLNVKEIPTKKIYPSVLMAIGVIIFFSVFPQLKTSIDANSLTGLALAAICITGAALWFKLEKPYYSLKLGSPAGEADWLLSKDTAYLQEIAGVINQAVLSSSPPTSTTTTKPLS